jgi:hypothetical protein|tara:strand:- start:2276 stop:2524 length:249 start_codon:yes stop_codon:yes gene_type:complete
MKLKSLKSGLTDTSDLILEALVLKYQSELAAIAVNMDNYLNHAVGVAEHPDIVGEVDKLIEQSAAVEEKLTIANQLLSVSES